MRARTILVVLWVVQLTAAVLAQSAPIQYTVRFSAPHSHYFEVEMSVPCQGDSLDLYLPVWTPGSYMVREYSRNLEGFVATTATGTGLDWKHTGKNHWQVDCKGQGQVKVNYRMYAHELTVRSNWVERDFALLQGAASFLTVTGEERRPYEVSLILPSHWKTAVSGLAAHPDGAAGHFLAQDYDQLVDCPILAGSPAIYPFQVAGTRHYLVNEGEGGVWNGPRSAADVKKLVEVNHRMWGSFPYAEQPPRAYYFLNLLTGPGGGLEHKNSTVMMSARWAMQTPKEYRDWLDLVAHEYFHTWNVKRLRPVALGPFDYEHENYTPSLWIAEGFTSYYDSLSVRRAGLSDDAQYLEALSKSIERLQTTHGRLVQPLADSSFDAWIKFYRPDENSGNVGISYYTKGSLVAFLLDAHIRRATGDAKSLDDVMRLAYQRYSGERGYTEEQFRAVASEVAGQDLTGFFKAYVDELKELDYTPALEYYGLRFKTPEKPKAGESTPVYLGISSQDRGGRLIVTAVQRDTPAFEAGLNVDDEIVALDNYRISNSQLERRLKGYKPGATVEVLIARREELRKLSLRLAPKPRMEWKLEVDPEAPASAARHREGWLKTRLPAGRS